MYKLLYVWFHKIRYYILIANSEMDKLKEPWKFIASFAIILPFLVGVIAADIYNNFNIVIASIVYIGVVMFCRTYWFYWFKKYVVDKGKKK